MTNLTTKLPYMRKKDTKRAEKESKKREWKKKKIIIYEENRSFLPSWQGLWSSIYCPEFLVVPYWQSLPLSQAPQ